VGVVVTAQVPRARVDQELARARGARRLLPWTALTAIGGAALGLVAGGGVRAAGALFALGLAFAAFVWVSSIARCPACGARLRPRERRLESCPSCRARYA
jgi:hypothetical protein